MKAAVLDDRLHVAELDEPVPGPGEVAIRVAYAGIQWGDVLVRDGVFPLPHPSVPGFEAAGRITSVGEGVDPSRIGTSVTALTTSGAFAEVAVASAALTFDTGTLDQRTAAAFGWSAPTAYDLVHTVARVQAGDSVLIHAAAGGVGTLAAQLAKAAGAHVAGVTSTPAKAGYAARFGYDRVLTRDEFTSVRDHFDLILDPVGGPTRLKNLELLAPHGRLVVYGNLATFTPVTISADDLLTQGGSVLTYNSTLLSRTHPDRLAATARQALALIRSGALHLDVTAEHDLSNLPAALHALATGATQGKTILRLP